ncbi:ribose-phosphate pyrophosphokinase [Orenia metallireducens]|jgi:ribose-phosphate pyrophosphokinase|uniref:Ribose-phosphate pyrophosphokinase n=1 Tax=Orenia metallireducens TaxID=1413210 RepID=A0A285H095_9FIRM|nr:ribose-phosphate pyrophosphokinase [Orenia metallireducens]PRX26493.1 ribose-phosphate pyrophosphokinase [Orenia metallireducens]SNY28964.1 ribose-phosphate pyrophosphokinase [Orenia metallireducens]
MPSSNQELKIITGNANPKLAEEICKCLGTKLVNAEVKRFSDGEIGVEIEDSVRGDHVFVVQPTCPAVNDNLMELLVIIDALKRASAKEITAVVPYYGYARQDRKAKPRDPITAKLVANLIAESGADRVVAIDLHARQIQGFFDIPVDNLLGAPRLAEYFNEKQLEDVIVVAPDIGGVKRARDFADKLNTSIAIIDKRRPKANVSEVMNIIGDVDGKNVILVDDMIDTAGTICNAARALKEHGAKEIFATCTHPLFSGPAIERLEEAPITELVVTNTIPLAKEKLVDKFTVLSVAPLLSEGIERIYKDLSVSVLF